MHDRIVAATGHHRLPVPGTRHVRGQADHRSRRRRRDDALRLPHLHRPGPASGRGAGGSRRPSRGPGRHACVESPPPPRAVPGDPAGRGGLAHHQHPARGRRDRLHRRPRRRCARVCRPVTRASPHDRPTTAPGHGGGAPRRRRIRGDHRRRRPVGCSDSPRRGRSCRALLHLRHHRRTQRCWISPQIAVSTHLCRLPRRWPRDQ